MTAHVERPQLFFLLFLFQGALSRFSSVSSRPFSDVGRYYPLRLRRGGRSVDSRVPGRWPTYQTRVRGSAIWVSPECLRYGTTRALLLAASTTFSFQSVAPPPLPFTSSIALHRFILW
ncbi:hypothetical protein C8J57DRAFT_1531556 [Mycena rebaudengoi]|nr:hypothetical protein C8J57DRAFT_1531556 [Mycena rebaudengoi]